MAAPRVLIFINGSRLTVPAPPTLLPCSVAARCCRSRHPRGGSTACTPELKHYTPSLADGLTAYYPSIFAKSALTAFDIAVTS